MKTSPIATTSNYLAMHGLFPDELTRYQTTCYLKNTEPLPASLKVYAVQVMMNFYAV